MKLIKDKFLVKLEKLVEDTVKVNGVEMYLDSSYDPMRFARQYGEVVIAPERLSSKYMDVKVGDRIYFHHFVADKKIKWLKMMMVVIYYKLMQVKYIVRS